MSRIGSVYNVDWYLCGKANGLFQGNFFDLFYLHKTDGIVSNFFWLKLWKRTLFLSPFGKLIDAIAYLNRFFPSWEKYVINIPDVVSLNEKNSFHVNLLRAILNTKDSFLNFTSYEEEEGRYQLAKMGIGQEAMFICFHARDPLYLRQLKPTRDFNYHNFRDSTITNYLLAAENIIKLGFYAIRMGAVVEQKLSSNNPKLIDYATNGNRNEFMDVYLGAKCYFFICSDTGMSIVPELFRRPIVFVNWTALGRLSTYVLNAIFIPKKLFSRKKNRFLTFREIINSPIVSASTGDIFENMGIDVIENTSQEILEATLEMYQRLTGQWKTTIEDEQLQETFWRLYIPKRTRSLNFRISAAFLRNNQELLR